MNKLKEILIKRGIKQVDLVKKFGVDPSRISMQINGVRPLPLRYQIKLADLLHIPLQELRSLAEQEVGNE